MKWVKPQKPAMIQLTPAMAKTMLRSLYIFFCLAGSCIILGCGGAAGAGGAAAFRWKPELS
jgi:hypothetical protein